jgi:dolichol-phosphate mannosyltransferase
MSRLAADGVFANTSKPLFFGFKTGLLFLFLGGAGLLTLLTLSVLSLLSVVPPVDVGLYILSAVCFGAGILIVNNCIQGAYIARIYDEVKDRPNYIIESKSNFE